MSHDQSKWRGASLASRQYFMFNEMHVNYPGFVQALKDIKHAALACERQDVGRGILLIVPSGAGKSYMSKYFQRIWPANHDGDVSSVPVVSFRMSESMEPRTIAERLIQAIEPFAATGRTEKKNMDRVKTLLPQIKTRVVLIDQVHDVARLRSDKTMADVSKWLRDFIDDSKRLVVLMGIPEILQLPQRDRELRRRAKKHIRIDYFNIDSPGQLALFNTFLNRYVATLPIAEPSPVGQDLTKMIYYATCGIFDYIQLIFSEAIEVAVTVGREHITQADLATGMEKVFGAAINASLNPFLPSGPSRLLDREGEPYYQWLDHFALRPGAEVKK